MHFSSRDLTRISRNPRAMMNLQAGNFRALENFVEQAQKDEKMDEYRRFFVCVERSGTKIPREHINHPDSLGAIAWFKANLKPDHLLWYNRLKQTPA